MSQPVEHRLFRKRRVRSYVSRGRAYCWLRAYHTEVEAALAREEHTWAVLVADMSIDDVKGRNGARLTPNAALRVWQRVCRDVETDARKPKPTGGKFPSRMPADWRPQTVIPPSPIRPPLPVPTAIPSTSTAVTNPTPSDKPSDGLEALDRAFALLEADDRRKFRFGG